MGKLGASGSITQSAQLLSDKLAIAWHHCKVSDYGKHSFTWGRQACVTHRLRMAWHFYENRQLTSDISVIC